MNACVGVPECHVPFFAGLLACFEVKNRIFQKYNTVGNLG